MKKIKRPNTIKMKRLLMHFIECDVADRTTLRELQEDARKVIYLDEDLQPGQRESAARTRKTPRPVKREAQAAPRRRAASRRR